MQVIVKIANIIITPDNPEYYGGVWHVEGMLNERIVASGIYYYMSENISESLLSFREAVSEPEHEQDDSRGVREIYGLEKNRALCQQRESVITREDRCIAFPNSMQHKVEPFDRCN